MRIKDKDTGECELSNDEERIKDLYDGLYDLIARCMDQKRSIVALDTWIIVHNLEAQLCLAYEVLRRYLAERGLD